MRPRSHLVQATDTLSQSIQATRRKDCSDPISLPARQIVKQVNKQTPAAVHANLDISNEPEEVHRFNGLTSKKGPTAEYARRSLLARRLVERGVRFIEVLCPSVGHDRWDQHSNLQRGHEDNARTVDRPCSTPASPPTATFGAAACAMLPVRYGAGERSR